METYSRIGLGRASMVCGYMNVKSVDSSIFTNIMKNVENCKLSLELPYHEISIPVENLEKVMNALGENTLETSEEDVIQTLETSEEDVKYTRNE